MATTRPIPVDNTGQALLEILRHMGVKYFFANAGSDFTMLIDGFARFEVEHKTNPAPIQIPHETCAVSMAHGYYLATGEPPVVMVHSTVGTGNALCGLINAARANVPLILMAGRPPINETGNPGTRDITIHWSQEAFDQGELVRQFVKWDYELRNFDQLEMVIRRAFAIAMSEPRGPVYLSLPRDVMTENPGRELIIAGETNHFFSTTKPQPDVEHIRKAASLIANAKQPLIITRSFGRNKNGVQDLVALAQSFAIAVVEFEMPDCVNFPGDNPLHQGFDPSGLVPQSDVILVIDCPMPWSPKFAKPRAGTTIVHLGFDPIYSRIPVWGFPCTLAIAGDPSAAVRMLTKALQELREIHVMQIAQRFELLQAQHAKNRPRPAHTIQDDPMARVAACLNEFKEKNRDGDLVFVQEYDLGMNRKEIEFATPSTYFGFGPSGGLGFGMGGALGVKLGRPQSAVVSVIGDGVYILGAAIATHMVSAAQKLPVLWVVCNNHGWGALALFTQLVQQQTAWWRDAKDFPLVRFPCPPAYEQICQACGGWGEAVEQLDDLPSALDRALYAVRTKGQQALLNVNCGEPYKF